MSGVGRWPWFELQVPDVEKAKAFYAAVAGWESVEMDMGGFVYPMMGPSQERCGCGVTPPPPGDGLPRWVGYCTVDDVDAACARAAEAGARAVGAPQEVPGVGKMAEVVGPDGAIFWVYRATDPGGLDLAPGFAWHELYTHDPEGGVAFVRAVVGGLEHGTMDLGPEPYHLLKGPSGAQTGVMRQPHPEAPSAWMLWIEVPDADAAAARVDAAGGVVVAPCFDVPGIGRMFMALDDQGAMVGFLASAAPA